MRQCLRIIVLQPTYRTYRPVVANERIHRLAAANRQSGTNLRPPKAVSQAKIPADEADTATACIPEAPYITGNSPRKLYGNSNGNHGKRQMKNG